MDFNAWLGIATLLVPVIGGILTFVWKILKAPRKKLVYSIFPTQLIEKNTATSKHIISVDGKQVENLVLSKVRFINTGNQPINFSDFSTMAPLSIKTTGRLFSAENTGQIYLKDLSSPIALNVVDESTVQLHFDFINPRCPILIEVLHDGNIEIEGSLKAGKVFFSDFSMLYLVFFILFIISTIILILSFLVSLYLCIDASLDFTAPLPVQKLGGSILSSLFFFLFSLIISLCSLNVIASLEFYYPKRQNKEKHSKS